MLIQEFGSNVKFCERFTLWLCYELQQISLLVFSLQYKVCFCAGKCVCSRPPSILHLNPSLQCTRLPYTTSSLEYPILHPPNSSLHLPHYQHSALHHPHSSLQPTHTLNTPHYTLKYEPNLVLPHQPHQISYIGQYLTTPISSFTTPPHVNKNKWILVGWWTNLAELIFLSRTQDTTQFLEVFA